MPVRLEPTSPDDDESQLLTETEPGAAPIPGLPLGPQAASGAKA